MDATAAQVVGDVGRGRRDIGPGVADDLEHEAARRT
jgi:hypothetical protein